MDIFWHGQFCFEIKTPSASAKEKRTIVVDPVSKESGLKAFSGEADVLLLTCLEQKDNGISQIKGNPFVIEGPGEYEIKNIHIKGLAGFSEKADKKEPEKITIYKVETDGITFCHLGGFGQQELSPEQLEAINEVDILMLPIGGGRTIDGAAAQKIINQVEPKIVIPMYFHLPQLKEKIEPIDGFLKTIGREKIEPEPNFKARKDKLPLETKIVVLKP
jgi:hypothetical protein